MSALWLFLLSVVIGALLLWVGFVQERYGFGTESRPTAIDITTDDGWVIHAHFRAAVERRFEEPVVLCHGIANNFSFFEFLPPQNLAQFIAGLGFDTYAIDHRGDASSIAAEWGNDATFDDIVLYDVPAILKAIGAHSKRSGNVMWVGHSLGGLLGLAAARANPAIVAICTIGSPVFFTLTQGYRWLLRIGQWLSPAGLFPVDFVSRVLAPFAARVNVDRFVSVAANMKNLEAKSQRALMANGISPLWRGVLVQLEDWVRHDAFRSLGGAVDYREQVKHLGIPVLVVAGTVDGLAPLSVSKRYFELLTAPDKTFAGFGREYGHAEDYGHGDLIIGKNAHVDVYPAIGAWLTGHGTSSASPSEVPSGRVGDRPG